MLGRFRLFHVVARCQLFWVVSSCSGCQHDLGFSDCLLMCFSNDSTMFLVVVGGVMLF